MSFSKPVRLLLVCSSLAALAACGGSGGGGSASTPLPTYTIGGTVSGLATGASVVLQNNAGNNLTVSANGSFSFSTAINSGSNYVVSVLTQPSSPTQVCTVTSGSGTAVAAVTNVVVACVTSSFGISGTVSGLSGSVVIQNNGGGNQTISASGPFTFPAQLSGTAYAVTVLTQPATQTCTVANGSGTVGAAAVSNIAITCSTQMRTIGGTVAGLTGTGLVLNLNAGSQNLPVAANGAFTFASAVAVGTAYAVTVGTQPTAQTCSVASGTGTVAGTNITNVAVTCAANTFTVGGTVSGLATGGTVVLQNNGGNNLTVSANGSFAFATPLATGSAYAVTRLTNPTVPAGTPAGQTCTVLPGGSGTVASANVTSVAVACVTNDTTAPTVATKTPLPTTVGTALSVAVAATFSEAMDTTSITASTFQVKSGNALTGQSSVSGTIAFTTVSGATKATFTPSSALAFNTDYTITATTGVKDVAGNALASAVSWSFNTGKRITTGGSHACARFADGRLKCWGSNSLGQLGIDNAVNHGDGTGLMGDGTGANGSGLKPVAIPNVLGTGHSIVSVAAGDDHTCAIIETGRVFCWGDNNRGELGGGFTSSSVGDSLNDMEANVVPVDLGVGRTALQISLGNELSCALLDDGAVKCWGDGAYGALGQGNTTPSNVAVSINLGTGRKAIEIGIGGSRGCAILDNNTLKCWGDNRWGQAGAGTGEAIALQANTTHIGDNAGEMGDNLAAVNLGSVTPLHLAVDDGHTCVLTTAGAVRCFGNNTWGQAGSNLGNGAPSGFNDCDPFKNNCIGDNPNEMGNNLPEPIAAGGAVELTEGYRQTCVRTATAQIKCWGTNQFGQLGLGDNAFPLDDVGDGAGEIAALAAATMKPGKTVVELSGGGFYECVSNSDATSQCWGRNASGQLGRGNTTDVGANPGDMGAGLTNLDLGI